MIDDSFSVSLSSSKRRLNLRQNSRILKMHSFVKLFSILSSRGTTQTPSVKKNRRRRRVCYIARREKFRCDLQQRGERFLRFSFFYGGVLSLFFF